MKSIFCKFMVDSPELIGTDIGRIYNVFTETDIEQISVEENCYCRLFDISLLTKLENFPVIISHHIDLNDCQLVSHPMGLAIEVANKQDIRDAVRHEPGLLIAKSFESSGIAKECSALVLYQLLIAQNIAFSIHANTGYELFQAYLSSGVYGVVLPLKYLREDATPTLRFQLDKLTSLRLEIVGGPPKALVYQQMLRDKGVLAFIQQSYQLNLWEKPLEQTDKPVVKRKVLRYQAITGYKKHFSKTPCFYLHAPAAQALNVLLPIVQGPMSGVTITADFAVAVHQSGAFPFLALASLSNDEVENLVAKTAARKISFGVGIVAVSLSDDDFEQQIKTFEKYQPTMVLVGTPQLNHIQRLLKTNLKIAVHAPNRPLFKALYKMGVRCFVIEGGEAGGHISHQGGLSAWQEIFDEVREQSLQDKVHLILAGGIKGKEAKDLLTALLNFYGFEHSLKISLQLGSTYLASKQALELTTLNTGFQEQLLSIDDTFVTGESLSRGVRQLAIKNSEQTVLKEWHIFESDLSHEDKKRAYEKLYQGGLQRALASTAFVESGSYMAGSVSALLETQLNLDDIHQELTDPAPVKKKPAAQEAIAIVGIGLKLPGAESVEEHFYNIYHQRCFISDMPEAHFARELYLSADKEEELTAYTSLGALVGQLNEDLSKYRIPPIIASQISRSQKMALDASHKALTDAGYFEKPFAKDRTAVIIGTGGSDNNESLSKINWPEIRARLMSLSETAGLDFEDILDEYETRYLQKEITEDTRSGELSNIIAARVASVFDFKGETHTVDAACAASLASVTQAINLLRNHSSDVVLAGGVEERMGKDIYIEFSRIGAVSEQGCFPFDSKADGFVLGEGAVIYILKRYSDALKFGDKIYAVINGWGASSDGAGKGITAPSKEGQILALKRAYQDAQLSPALLDYIECHATATKVGDSTEFESLSEFLPVSSGIKKPVLGASKAMVGHLRTAAGAAGILQSLFVMNSRCFPGTINYQNHVQGGDKPFDVLKVPKRIAHKNKIICSVSSFGFGGTNYHLVLSSPEDNSAQRVLSKQQMVLPIYKLTGDVAWVFPGQGSQYEGMLAAYKDELDFIHLARQAATIFSQFSSVDLMRLLTEVNEEVRDKNEAILKSTEVSQVAIFFTSIIIGRKLLKLGIKPDLLIGHSLGEYSALCLAGVLSFEDAFRMLCIRGKLMSAELLKNPGTMIAIMADEMLAEKIIQQTCHYAACANLNAYNQTVISCSLEAVNDILKAADAFNVRATQLKVVRGFHSRFVSDCVDEMTSALESCQFYYPDTRVTANIKNQAYPYAPERCLQIMDDADRSQTIALLKRQIDHPVHFINQIQSAYASGIRRFVEVGPNNILTRLIEQINQGKYLQSIYLNKQGEASFDIAALAKYLQEEVGIKRVPLPKHETAARKIQAKTSQFNTNKISLIDEIRAVVATISGYELGSFDDNAEFERDLGIDTLKIFEILAQLRGHVLPQELGNFRELNSVNKILENCPQQAQPQPQVAEQTTPLDSIREVVASISGYDLKSLDDHAEFERDLGIDTLKIFEIIAQLRGHILPEELTDFRTLNSIHRLYTARDKSHDSVAVLNKPEKELVVYQYKLHPTAVLQCLTVNLNEFHIDADNGYSNSKQKSENKLLVFKVADSEDDLRHRVFPLLYNKTRAFIKDQAKKIIYISYGSDTFQEASVLGTSAFVKSVAKDYSDIEWVYNHFVELPDYENLNKQIISGIGLHALKDKVILGKFQKLQGFQCDLTQIPTQLSDKDHIIVTGGARGIASHLVKKLYAVCRARFTLIGRHQDTENWIQALDSQRISYLSIDITDKSAVEKYYAQLNDCTLLIHSAGIDHSKNFMQKTYDEFFEVIDVKVTGLFNILTCMSVDRVRALVMFSSTVSYWGNHGQADYGMANAVLNSKIAQFPCLSLAWTAWDEIGMASRGFVHDILTTKGARFIGLDEGSDIFQNALASFLANPYATHAQLLIAAKIPEDDKLNCTDRDAIHTIEDLDKSFVTEFTYDSQQFPELLDHQFNGKIFVPGSVILGSVLHEIDKKIKLDELTIELDKVEFLSPLIVVDSVPNQLKITRQGIDFLVEEIQQQQTMPIVSFSVNLAVHKDVLNFAYIKQQYDNTLPNLPIYEHPCLRRHSELGKHFQILETISFSQGVMRTTLRLNAGNAQLLQRLFAISNVLEACFQSCATTVHLLHHAKSVFLPSGLNKTYISFKALKKTSVMQLYVEPLVSHSKDAVFNVMAINEQGEPVINMKAFTASPVFDAKTVDYILFKNTLIKDSLSEGLFAEIDQLNKYYDDSDLTANEFNEINDLNSNKRINEKKAGKIACKMLTHWQTFTNSKSTSCLSHTEVLSTDQPVQVLLNGKPLNEFPCYSISHSDAVIYVARSKYPVGVDIEKIRPLDELTIKSIYANQCLAIKEFLAQAEIKSELQTLFPLILFTQKEAALKADGTGLSEGMDKVVVEKFSIDDTQITVNGKTYTVVSHIANDFIISKALLIPLQQEVQNIDLALMTKQLTKFQQTLLGEERQALYSYSLNHVVEFNHAVNRTCLFQAINGLFKEHDVLRSRFLDDTRQVVIRTFVEQDYTVEVSKESTAEIEERFIDDCSSYRYPLESDALYHIKIYQTAEGSTLLLMNFHHLILDCYNAFILSESLLKNYQLLIEGKATISAQHKQYYDLDIAATFEQGKRFWSTYLKAVDSFKFTLPDPKNQDNTKHYQTITHINKKGLEHFCRSQSVTLFIGLLGVLKLTFAKLYHKNDLVFFVPFSAKNTQNHLTLGPFIHLLPIRSKMDQNVDNDVLFSTLREDLYSAIEHQNEYIDTTTIENNHGIITQLMNSGEQDKDEVWAENIKRRNTDGINAHHPLILSFINLKENIHLDVTFNADIVSEMQLQDILNCFLDELNTVIKCGYLKKVEHHSYNAPRSPIEEALVAIWGDVLEMDKIGIDDNFFDLGGHSLLAVVLRTQINAKFNKLIPIEWIFQFPTISLLAQTLLTYEGIGNSKQDDIITPVQSEGSLAPFFWINGGQAVPTMREYLSTDQPFYLLNHQSLDGKKAKYLTLSEMVAYYTQAILQIDSKGPYYLGGYSVGGMLIYEIAQQLAVQGKRVALLFLLDPVGGTSTIKQPAQKLTLAPTSRYKKYKKLEPVFIFLKKCNRTRSKLRHKVNDIMVKGYFSLDKPLPVNLIWPYQLSFYKRAILDYRPNPPLVGINKIILIREKNVNSALWTMLLNGKAEIYPIDSTHLELMDKPYSLEWIEILAQALAKEIELY